MNLGRSIKGAECISEVRLDLVGPGRAGKSSLLMALQAENGVSELIRLDNRTVGMETADLQLGGVRATVLDLAGQEEYRALHAAFINSRSLHASCMS